MYKIPTPCLICGTNYESYFTKKFDKFGLSNVEYQRCPDCGFVHSKTHADLSADDWNRVNSLYHRDYQKSGENFDDPRWLDRIEMQATVIADLFALGLIPKNLPWIDFAAGGGQLSSALRAKSDAVLLNFDRYMQSPPPNPIGEPAPGNFDLVVTTSVFEHLRTRDELDSVNALVSQSGVMALHTLVREEIPRDPDWFYLLPVHCSFFSNKSMSTLFNQWGYKSSIYNLDSRLWLFFKRPAIDLTPVIEYANSRGVHRYILSDGFEAYWK